MTIWGRLKLELEQRDAQGGVQRRLVFDQEHTSNDQHELTRELLCGLAHAKFLAPEDLLFAAAYTKDDAPRPEDPEDKQDCVRRRAEASSQGS